MGRVFVLVTQFRNLTGRQVGFRVVGGFCSLPGLPPGKTRMVKQSRILRCCRASQGWKIMVLIDGQFTGVELDPSIVLNFVRVLFRYDDDDGDHKNGSGVLCVDGVRENHSSDFLLRHKYFGCMRNRFWDKRPHELIARSDSILAAKLRGLEDHGNHQHLAPLVDTTLLKQGQCASPMTTDGNHDHQRTKKDHPVIYVALDHDKNCKIKDQASDTTKDSTANLNLDSPNGEEANTKPMPKRERGSDINIGMERSITREQRMDDHDHDHDHEGGLYKDSFVHALLFLSALALVRFGPSLFV